MSQATQGAPAPASAPDQGRRAARRPRHRRVGDRRLVLHASAPPARTRAPACSRRRVPTTLSRLRLGAVAVCLVFGALTALQLTLSWQANRTAAADTEQLIRVQGIKTSLLRADALATNAFLIGGLEPAEQRAAYDDAIDQTVRAITDAAEAQPADRAALNALEQRGPRLRRRHGAGPGQQPPGPAGRRRLPAQGQRRAAVDGAAHRRRAGQRQLRPAPATRWAPTTRGSCFLPALVGVVLLWLANRWIGATLPPPRQPRPVPGARRPSASSGSSPPWWPTASRTRTTSSAPARSRPWSTGRRRAPPPTTPRPTRACG